MKSTGIVRRLDDLGRLVIPKEIRKQYRLKEGDSIEFYIDQDRIIIQKYDLLSRHVEEIKIMCETLTSMFENTVLFMQDEMLAAHGKTIAEGFAKKCKVHRVTHFEQQAVYENDSALYNGVLYPVVAYGDWYGAFVVLYDKRELSEPELAAVEAFAKVLTRQQEQ